MKRGLVLSGALVGLMALLLGVDLSFAHVPYLEEKQGREYSPQDPFVVTNVEKSIAVYAYLPPDDIDYYRFTLTAPTRVYIESLVPACRQYQEFFPAFTIAGQGTNITVGGTPFERETFYEPFGAKPYYQGPTFDEYLDAGTYSVMFWGGQGSKTSGDYVAVFGYKERWSLLDIARAIKNTPIIRNDGELHEGCAP